MSMLEFKGDRTKLDQEDLEGIKDIVRHHIEVRNRSFMKRVYRDCFLGSDAVDFMVEHGLADTRSQAVQIGRRLAEAKLIRHVGDNSKFKDASHLYYRFLEDDSESSMLAATNAGHGDMIDPEALERAAGGDVSNATRSVIDDAHLAAGGDSAEARGVGDTATATTGAQNDGEVSPAAAAPAPTQPLLGQNGNKWAFCPHTAHNSYILDIGLAEEIERVCSESSVSERAKAFERLRERVREEFSEDAPNWILSQSQEVENSTISVFHRKKPRGDFKNLKMTGVVGSGPKQWAKGIIGFDNRKQWEPMFEDGVVVEGIDIGEELNLDLDTIEETADGGDMDNMEERDGGDSVSTNRFISATSSDQTPANAKNNNSSSNRTADQPPSVPNNSTTSGDSNNNINNNNGDDGDDDGDDILAFLKTVELAGIPSGMSVAAVLNDPDRQTTLAHLRKQMMSSSPTECMECKTEFHVPSDIRFCPCCAMVCCNSCVRMRVFEISTRKVVNVCVHCFRESSRIKHPPKDGKDDAVRSKWWTPEELEFMFSAMNNNGASGGQSGSGSGGGGGSGNSTAPSPMLHGLDASMSMSYTGGGSANGNNAMDALVNAAAAGAPPAMVQVVEGRESVLEDDPESNLDGTNNKGVAAGSGSSSSSSSGGSSSSGLTRSNSRPLLSGLEGEEQGEEPLDSALPAAAASSLLGVNSSITDAATSNASATTTTGSSAAAAEAFRDTHGHESGVTRASTRAEELGDGVGREVDETDDSRLGPVPAASKARDIANKATKGAADGYARCRACGDLISRDVVSIEAHEGVCRGNPRNDNSNKGDKDAKAASSSSSSSSSAASSPGGGGFFSGIKSVLGWSSSSRTADGSGGDATGGAGVPPRSPKGSHLAPTGSPKATAKYPPGSPKQEMGSSGLVLDTTNTTGNNGAAPGESPRFAKLEKKFSFHTGSGGTPRAGTKDLSKSPARIIYRTARAHQSALFNFRPREVCALQDAFVDKDGSCYVYEVSVRHSEVTGSPGYVTADVLMHAFCAKPYLDDEGHVVESAANVSIISQVDTRAKGPGQFFLSLVQGADGSDTIGIPRREDIERELKSNGDLTDILSRKKKKKKKEKKEKKKKEKKAKAEGANTASDTEGEDSDEEDDDDDDDDDEEEEEGAAVSLDDFELLAVLGRGGFGKVMQVRHRPTQMVYAMKILKKSELVRRRQVERTQTERTILAAVKHPFIVCLHYAFQNRQKLYMVMDFVQGGDFFTLMRKFKRLPEAWVKIYIGEIALALQHLHDMDVVYRDLKPENILLCGDGHLKLTDFGLSRYFETRPPNPEDMLGEEQDVVTRSFCGTEQYMSPEMLLQQGHNFRMDWWCVGLLMHEMLSARHPFSGPSHYDTLRNMVTKQPNVDSRVSSGAASVVRSLLIKNPRARMCCQRGASELKNLAYFSDLDWDALIEKRIPMAHIPDLSGETDLSSFETTFTKEAPVDSMATDASGVAGSVASKAGSSSSKGEKKGGILSYLGLNDSSSAKKNKEKEAAAAAAAADNFKDFSFVKQDDTPSATAAAASDSDGAGNADSTADSAASGGGGEGGATSRSKADTPTAAAGAPPAFKPAAPIRKASVTPAATTAGAEAAVPPPAPV